MSNENQDKINSLRKLIKDLKEDKRILKAQVRELNKISDTCKKCECDEFLCGHNKRR